jgi:hypothetical protein
MGVRENACRFFVGNPKGKRPIRRPRLKWEYNIKIDHIEIIWELCWVYVAHDRDQ